MALKRLLYRENSKKREEEADPLSAIWTRLKPSNRFQYRKVFGTHRMESFGEIYLIGIIYLHENHDIRNRTTIKKKIYSISVIYYTYLFFFSFLILFFILIYGGPTDHR